MLSGWWTDAGTFECLNRASDLAAELSAGIPLLPPWHAAPSL